MAAIVTYHMRDLAPKGWLHPERNRPADLFVLAACAALALLLLVLP